MNRAMKDVFLRDLAQHGIVRLAAQTANPQTKTGKGAARAFYDERLRDPNFAEAWDEAVEEAGAQIEAEIVRRGVNGFEEQRMDANGRVTILRRYSDPCLLALARARIPAFRKSDVELSGKLEQVNAEDQKLAAEVRKLATKLSGDSTRPPTVEHLAAAIQKQAIDQADQGAALLAELAEDAIRGA